MLQKGFGVSPQGKIMLHYLEKTDDLKFHKDVEDIS
jgi:hypothetical protein